MSASAEGYIRAYTSVHSSESGISLSGGEVMLYLYRKRYVLIRYACNHDDSRDLSPEKVGQRRAAVADGGSVPDLRGDWLVRQQGEDVNFEIFRSQSYFGFAPAPRGRLSTSCNWPRKTTNIAARTCGPRPD